MTDITATPSDTTADSGNASSSTAASSFDFRSVITDDGKFTPNWTERLPDHLKPAAQEFGKYPDIGTFLGGHWAKAQMLGQRPTVKPPGEGAKPEEITAWRRTLGVPDAPEGYRLTKPDQLPEGVHWDEREAADFAKLAHDMHLTPDQVQKLVSFDLNQRAGMAARGIASMDAFVASQHETLQAQWGEKTSENIAAASRAAALLGIDASDPEIGNNAKIIQALHSASRLFQEDKLLGADRAGPGMSGSQQAEDIRRNPGNPWHRAYLGEEGLDRQQEAAHLMMRLQGVKLPA